MNPGLLSVREIQYSDIDALVLYWLNANPAFLTGMGVDLAKMPKKDEFEKMLKEQLEQPYNKKKSYCIIWQYDNIPVGHSNINKIIFGEEAYMHLHLWDSVSRQKGMGTSLIKLTLHFFFNNYRLKKLY